MLQKQPSTVKHCFSIEVKGPRRKFWFDLFIYLFIQRGDNLVTFTLKQPH